MRANFFSKAHLYLIKKLKDYWNFLNTCEVVGKILIFVTFGCGY